MAIKEVLQAICDRCFDTEVMDGSKVKPQSTKVSLQSEFFGDLEWDYLCVTCIKTVGNYLDLIRKAKKKESLKAAPSPVIKTSLPSKQ